MMAKGRPEFEISFIFSKFKNPNSDRLLCWNSESILNKKELIGEGSDEQSGNRYDIALGVPERLAP